MQTETGFSFFFFLILIHRGQKEVDQYIGGKKMAIVNSVSGKTI